MSGFFLSPPVRAGGGGGAYVLESTETWGCSVRRTPRPYTIVLNIGQPRNFVTSLKTIIFPDLLKM